MSSASGLAVGLLAGLGTGMAFAASPFVRRRHLLEARLGPYVHDTPRPSRLLDDGVVIRPLVRAIVRRIDGILGGSSSVSRRLDSAGGALSLDEFRAEQVVWGAAGGALGLGVGLLLALRAGATAVVPVLLMTVVGAIGGVLTRDKWLSRAVAERERRIAAEFPTVAEMLALAVTAGEGAVGALERVTRSSRGELARELARALAEARAGASLTTALDAMAARSSVPALIRFVDGMVIAVQRGTPLADVLRAQAADAREAGKRALLEAGGRREISMMIPVVFLILPVTVLFALFPGYYGLTFSSP